MTNVQLNKRVKSSFKLLGIPLVYMIFIHVNAKDNSNESAQSQQAQEQQRLIANRCKPLTKKTIKTQFKQGKGGHVLVEGLFNNQQHTAIVDTGGIGVGGVISQKVLNEVQPQDKKISEGNVQGANHSRAMKMTQLQSTGIGEASANNLNFVITPSAVLPNEAEVLIGSEFLCSFIAEFNFKNNQLVLYPQSTSLQSLTQSKQTNKTWSLSKSHSRIAGALIIDMTLNGKPIKAVVDTGAKHSIINWKAANLIGINRGDKAVTVEENKASGIHGDAADKSYKITADNLAVAHSDISINNLDLRVSDLGSFNPLVDDVAAINLGVDFFNNRRLIIDYANRQVVVSD